MSRKYKFHFAAEDLVSEAEDYVYRSVKDH